MKSTLEVVASTDLAETQAAFDRRTHCLGKHIALVRCWDSLGSGPLLEILGRFVQNHSHLSYTRLWCQAMQRMQRTAGKALCARRYV